MSQAMDYVEYLSREIGARTPGSEEEELAALYIADEIQKETGFSATIEEFQSSANLEGARAIVKPHADPRSNGLWNRMGWIIQALSKAASRDTCQSCAVGCGCFRVVAVVITC
jgi:hypothetical protein